MLWVLMSETLLMSTRNIYFSGEISKISLIFGWKKNAFSKATNYLSEVSSSKKSRSPDARI